MDTTFGTNKEKIVNTLKTTISNLQCPFCKTNHFTLGGGYFAHDLQHDLQSRQMGGINIPTIPLICRNCGFVAEFSAGSLGLLPRDLDTKA